MATRITDVCVQRFDGVGSWIVEGMLS